MGIEKILEYQELDKKLYALENDFRKSKEVEELNNLQTKYKENRAFLTKLAKEAKDLMAGFGKCVAKLDEVNLSEGAIAKESAAVFETEQELDAYDKALAKYQDGINAVERETNRLIKRLNDIKAETQSGKKQSAAISAKFKQVKDVHDRIQKEVQNVALPIMKELKALREQIDEKTMQKYLALRNERKMPAFVPYLNKNCFACGMEISVEVDKYLKNPGDYTECPNCRRIVFLK